MVTWCPMRSTPSTRPTPPRNRRALCCAVLGVAEGVGQPDLRDRRTTRSPWNPTAP
ncbi:hypothetical protein PF005_g5110 [Phytophthora fragariae]|uniref:Uncharacterized protein n=1 Tax=Phytophthora fragariae TaxID=53985 RepID=A0A6A4DQ16_9STRA|nr:hypothetical protein PF003_g40695 [Phytophthora fragariae]KAE8944511.1 hypothetical protein PF009_g5809 [Phytophthora fragariae]KAE9025179.1 hypothetical protein PF011_g3139 [Phytophthora fragariae]KAE9112383.1 hypothetical protein PF010_g10468 [Phytophthora fragariae]KAE9130145.1 hypothetical protein PF007_g4639 [Phytophthora fragariae]